MCAKIKLVMNITHAFIRLVKNCIEPSVVVVIRKKKDLLNMQVSNDSKYNGLDLCIGGGKENIGK